MAANKSKQSSKKASKPKSRRKVKSFTLPIGFRREIKVTVKRKARSKKASRNSKRAGINRRLNSFWRNKSAVVASMLIVIGIVGITYFGWRSIQSRTPLTRSIASSTIPAEIKANPKHRSGSLPRSEPTRIRIPDVAINASIMSVGRKSDGTIEVPAANVTGWYKSSPTPGEIGPAVIVGHLDSVASTAIFWRLRELQPGQIVEIDRADGKTAKFKVDAVSQVPQKNFPSKQVYGNTDNPTLRMITCAGTFDRATRQYSDNLVVFASLVK